MFKLIVLLLRSVKEDERRLTAALERRDQLLQDVTEAVHTLDQVCFIMHCVV